MGRMPLRTRLRLEEVGFDTESFVREIALDIVTGRSRVSDCRRNYLFIVSISVLTKKQNRIN